MRDGLYKVQFQTPIGAGAGVVVLKDGKLLGGDSMMYYVGTYSTDGDKFTAKLTTGKHTTEAGMRSVLGMDRVTLTITGVSRGDSGEMVGKAAEVPNLPFQALFKLLSD